MDAIHRYPYTNFHDLNLDWVMENIEDLKTKLMQFVSLNAIKYANPFQWSITSQYPVNTLVMDPETGTAYLSTQPVPTGVPLTNTNYWTPVFTLQNFTDSIKEAITRQIPQQENGQAATQTIPAGSYFFVGDTLCTNPAEISDTSLVIIGSNCQQISVLELINALSSKATTLENQINTETQAREQADTQLSQQISAEATAREQADTQLSGQISAEATAREQADNQLSQQISAEATAREQADTQLTQQISAEAEAREQADTEIDGKIKWVDVVAYGVDRTGNTDVTAKVQSLIGPRTVLFFRAGTYKFNPNATISAGLVHFEGEQGTQFTGGIKLNSGRAILRNIQFAGDGNGTAIWLDTQMSTVTLDSLYITGWNDGIINFGLADSVQTIKNCTINQIGHYGIYIRNYGMTVVDSCYITQCVGHGIASGYAPNVDVGQVTIRGCKITECGYTSTPSNRLGGGIFLYGCNQPIIVNNYFYNTFLEAINLEDCAGEFMIAGNTCQWNDFGDDFGICIYAHNRSMYGGTIANNNVWYSANSCIAVTGDSGTNIVGHVTIIGNQVICRGIATGFIDSPILLDYAVNIAVIGNFDIGSPSAKNKYFVDIYRTGGPSQFYIMGSCIKQPMQLYHDTPGNNNIAAKGNALGDN